MKKLIFEFEDGYGYEIVDAGGNTIIRQEYDPDLPGYAAMDQAAAEAKADIVLSRLTE